MRFTFYINFWILFKFFVFKKISDTMLQTDKILFLSNFVKSIYEFKSIMFLNKIYYFSGIKASFGSRILRCVPAFATTKRDHFKEVNPCTDSYNIFSCSRLQSSLMRFSSSIGYANLFLPRDIHAFRKHSRACQTDAYARAAAA